MSTNRPYLTTLTPLRGIAALLVVIFHANLMVTPFIEPFGANLVGSGWMWVDFFFVLSGFIMCYVYGNNFNTAITLASYGTYLRARFARVYPLHLVTLIWCFIGALIVRSYADGLAPFFDQFFSLFAAIPSLFLVQSMGLTSTASLNTPSWSLSTEWWMYMIFPFLVPLFFRMRRFGMLIALIFVAGLFVCLKYYLSVLGGGPPTLNVLTDYGFFRCMAGFLLGMITFKIYDDTLADKFFKHDFTFIVFSAILIVLMSIGTNELAIVAVFPFIILSAAYNISRVKNFLDRPFLQRLGDWSFSIYMVHVPIIYIFSIIAIRNNPKLFAVFPPPGAPIDVFEGIKMCTIIVLLTLSVAALTYNYIEVPCREYLNSKIKPSRVAA